MWIWGGGTDGPGRRSSKCRGWGVAHIWHVKETARNPEWTGKNERPVVGDHRRPHRLSYGFYSEMRNRWNV